MAEGRRKKRKLRKGEEEEEEEGGNGEREGVNVERKMEAPARERQVHVIPALLFPPAFLFCLPFLFFFIYLFLDFSDFS